MSATMTQAETDIQTLVATNAKMAEDLTAIKAAIAAIPVGQVFTQADADALHAAVGGAVANTTEADAIVPTGTVTTP